MLLMYSFRLSNANLCDVYPVVYAMHITRLSWINA